MVRDLFFTALSLVVAAADDVAAGEPAVEVWEGNVALGVELGEGSLPKN
jgi:hypothetical protein